MADTIIEKILFWQRRGLDADAIARTLHLDLAVVEDVVNRREHRYTPDAQLIATARQTIGRYSRDHQEQSIEITQKRRGRRRE